MRMTCVIESFLPRGRGGRRRNKEFLGWLLGLFVANSIELCSSIEMTAVEIPRYQTVNSQARLTCNYDLGNDRLYSIKWYKDGSEFYRFVPKDSPPSQVFDVPHVRVDGTAGSFTCEASSEAPKFKTVSGNGEMDVVDLPDSKPIVSGGRAKGYRVGDILDVNCTSPNSKPAAQLEWYINNEKVDRSYLIMSPPFKSQAGLYTANLRLRFALKRHHFVQGHVTVKCTATIYTMYFQSSQLYLTGLGLGEKALESRRTNDAAGSHAGIFFLLFISSIISAAEASSSTPSSSPSSLLLLICH